MIRQFLTLVIPLTVGGTFGWVTLHLVDQRYALGAFTGGIFVLVLWMVIDTHRTGRKLVRSMDRLRER